MHVCSLFVKQSKYKLIMDCKQCYATALKRIPTWKPHHSVYDIYSDVHHLSLYCVSNSCHYTHYFKSRSINVYTR